MIPLQLPTLIQYFKKFTITKRDFIDQATVKGMGFPWEFIPNFNNNNKFFSPESGQKSRDRALGVQGDDVPHVEEARGPDDLPHGVTGAGHEGSMARVTL